MHLDVARATVTQEQGTGRETARLVASVVPAERVVRRIRSASRERRLREWRDVYGAVYKRQQPPQQPGDDFGVWTSSYDRRPIERAGMAEWRDTTVDTVMSLRPRRVLEIGAGSGLILSRVAPSCEQYWATDLSGEAVDLLAHAVGSEPGLRETVELLHRPAHDFDGLPRGGFDVVVVNSVVQYFPDTGYLSDVLRGASSVLAPGGAVLLGDLRNRGLRRSLYTAAALRRDGGDAGAEADLREVREAVDQRLRRENELFLDPEYFSGPPERLGGLSAVDVRLRRGAHHNELTRHRYDVLLYGDPVRPWSPESATALRWGEDIADAAALARWLTRHPATAATLRRGPNRRLLAETATQRALAQGLPAGACRRILREGAPDGAGLDPEECHLLGAAAGFAVRTTWSAGSGEGHFDVAFVPATAVPADSGDERFVLVPQVHGEPLDADREPEALDGPQADAFVASLTAYLAKVFPGPAFPGVDVVLSPDVEARSDGTCAGAP
jgi:SAM-dependent methyltransferase